MNYYDNINRWFFLKNHNETLPLLTFLLVFLYANLEVIMYQISNVGENENLE